MLNGMIPHNHLPIHEVQKYFTLNVGCLEGDDSSLTEDSSLTAEIPDSTL